MNRLANKAFSVLKGVFAGITDNLAIAGIVSQPGDAIS